MKKISTLITLIFVFAISLTAQTYINPPFEEAKTPAVDIKKVEITKNYTIVTFVCTAPETFVYGGWACASPDMYIEDIDRKKKYYIQKAKGIPMCPDKHTFTKPGESIRFQLYFPKLRHDVRNINIVEHAENGFTFYKIYLKPVA